MFITFAFGGRGITREDGGHGVDQHLTIASFMSIKPLQISEFCIDWHEELYLICLLFKPQTKFPWLIMQMFQSNDPEIFIID